MQIRHLCYELYKIDWKRTHMITDEIEEDAIIDYYEELANSDEFHYAYEDYLEEFGYNGEIYACYIEFLGNEYLDNEYMHKLLRHYLKLTELYDKDVEEFL